MSRTASHPHSGWLSSPDAFRHGPGFCVTVQAVPPAGLVRVVGDHSNVADDHREGDLFGAKPEHSPAVQNRLQVCLQVGVEAASPVVAAQDPDAALDLDQAAAGQVGEVGAPAALGAEAEFPFEGRPPASAQRR